MWLTIGLPENRGQGGGRVSVGEAEKEGGRREDYQVGRWRLWLGVDIGREWEYGRS